MKKGCFTQGQYLKICPLGSNAGIFYRQSKFHKLVKHNCSSFSPILPPIATLTYDLVKFLVPILKCLTEN